MSTTYDIIIIGTGIAGLSTGLNVDPSKKVLILTKDMPRVSNTNLAQGGIAVTFDPNYIESHVQDTLKTGNFYNDEGRLRKMIQEGGAAINTLINWGVNFDRDDKGKLLLTKEGGHSHRRIIHYKDTTGEEIVKGLLAACKERSNIHLVDQVFVKDILCNDQGVYGVEVLYKQSLCEILSQHVVLATGGIGEIYANTTNAPISTGDGLAMAYRAGAHLQDMEFVQFHPTALNVPGHSHFLISEAVRGEGGILRNQEGQAFMEAYHELKDLAPRSVVSKAIYDESKKQGSQDIYLDVTHMEASYILKRFPNIYKECLKRGIDITKDWIPIIPVQHYIMGGIQTDDHGKTNIAGLYACGEVACTRVHGANRMASNSLLEAAVYANRVADHINQSQRPVRPVNWELINRSIQDVNYDIHLARKRLRQVMGDSVFIFRRMSDLKSALEEIKLLTEELPAELMCESYFELKNMLLVSQLIIGGAIERKESLGSHIIEGE